MYRIEIRMAFRHLRSTALLAALRENGRKLPTTPKPPLAGCSGQNEVLMSLMPMSLRLETADGTAIEEYRIDRGAIEVRRLSDLGDHGTGWRRLTPAQLRDQVNRKTLLAQWLERRLGWRKLLRACLEEENLWQFEDSDRTLDQRVA